MTDFPNDRPPLATSEPEMKADSSGLNVEPAGWFATWFVAPIVIPAFLALLVAARAFYVAYQ